MCINRFTPLLPGVVQLAAAVSPTWQTRLDGLEKQNKFLDSNNQ